MQDKQWLPRFFCMWDSRIPGAVTEMYMHIGNLVRQKVIEKGLTIVWFAEQLSCTRVNVYKIFSKRSIDTDMLFRISKILDYDFFRHYSDLFEE